MCIRDRLNYALIDQPTVEMPGTQNVLLSIGDENTVIESAVLDYVNETTGKTYQAQASMISPLVIKLLEQ